MTTPTKGPATQSSGNPGGFLNVGWSGTNQTAIVGPDGLLVPFGGGGGIALSAGANSQSTGTVVFSNANGVSFGLDGLGNVTASVVPGGSNLALYDGANSISSGTAQFSNANGVSFGFNGQTITASIAAVGGAQTGISSLIAGQTQSVGALSFSNANGVTFGIASGANTGTLTASVSQSVQTQASGAIVGSGFTTNATAGVVLVGTNNSAGLNLGVPAWITTQTVQTQASGNIAGSGFTSAGANIGLSGTQNSAGLSLSATVAAQTNQTVASGNIAGTGLTTTTTAGVVIVGTNSTNGLSLAVPNWITTWTVPGATVFSNSNNVSFGLNGSTVTATATFAQSVQPVAASASNGSFAFSTLGFSNANGVTFGTSAGSIVTASVAAAGGAQTGISGIADSANTQTVGTLSFANSNGVTFGLSTGANTATMTASVAAQSVQGQTLTVSAANTSYTVPSLSFSNANNVSFSLSNNSQIYATVTVPAQTVQSAIKAFGASNTGNTAGNTGVSTGIDWVLAGTNNVTISESTAAGGPNTLWISGPTVGGAQTGISSLIAGQSQTVGALSFSNANGVTFGIASGANTGTLTASVAAQSNQTGGIYFTAQTTGQSSSSTYDLRTLSVVGDGIISAGWSNGTVRISATQSVQTQASGNIAGSGFTSAGNNIGLSGTNNSAGLSLSATVAAQTNQTGGIYITAQSTGQSSSSTYDVRTLSMVGDGIVSIGWSNSTLRVSATQSNQAASASNGSFAFQTLNFSNANGVTFGTSAGGIISASVAAAGGAQTGISGIADSANTQTVGTLSFANSNGVTFGLSTGANTATMTASVAAQSAQTGGIYAMTNTVGDSSSSTYDVRSLSISFLTAGILSAGMSNGSLFLGARVRASAGGSSVNFQNLTFSNSNNVSFGLNTAALAGTITGSFAINVSAPGGTSNALSGLTFSNANGVSFGLSTGAGVGTITASVAAGGGANLTAFATSNTTQSSTGVLSSNSMIFAGAGIASVGVSNGSVIISVPSGGGGITAINVSDSATSENITQLVFSNGNGVNFGLATAGGGPFATITASAVPTYTALTFQNRQLGASTHTNGNNSLWIAPFRLVAPVNASTIMQMVTLNGTATSNQTNTVGASLQMALWQQTATNPASTGRFDTVWSNSYALSIWNSGTVSQSYSIDGGTAGQQTSSSSGGSNISSQYLGMRQFTFNVGSTFNPGLYAYGFRISTSSAGASSVLRSFNPVMDSPMAVGGGMGFGTSTNASVGYADGGTYGTTTNNIPANFNITDVKQMSNVMPFFKMGAL